MFTPLFLTASRDLLMFEDLATYLLFVIPLIVSFWLMRHVFLETTKPKVKTALLSAMVVLYVATVLWLASLFTRNVATVEQCSYAWAMAFVAVTVIAVMETFIIYICRPKRQMTDADKMKLKDI